MVVGVEMLRWSNHTTNKGTKIQKVIGGDDWGCLCDSHTSVECLRCLLRFELR
jgi:hypothetical protein